MKKAMTYHELVEKVRTALVVKADASKIQEHIAVQVNVTGEAEGAFYIEIENGEIKVEPYDYVDRDILITCDAADMLAIAQGKKKFETALAKGAIKFEGSVPKATKLAAIMPTKKSTRKAKTEEAEETPVEEGQIALVEDAPAEAPVEEKPKKKTTRKTKTAEKTEETPKKKGRRTAKEDK